MGNALVIIDGLPRDAKTLVTRASAEIDAIHKSANKEITDLQKTTDAQAERLRQQAEQEIAHLRERAEQQISALAEESDRKVQARVEQTLAELEPLLQSYFQAAQLDETLAIRSQIKQLQDNPTDAEPAPANLGSLANQVGKTFHFLVTGATKGGVWGTDVYTSDSALACAAVHAGRVQPGEKKVVRVTIVPPPPSYKGTKRNGITSRAYGKYNGAYRLG